jgi:hypothetical protein
MDIFNKHEDEAKRKTQIEKIQSEEKQKRINFGMTFSTQEGFEVLKDLAKNCHFTEPSMVIGDTHETAFREGERKVFLYILAQLSAELQSKLLGG